MSRLKSTITIGCLLLSSQSYAAGFNNWDGCSDWPEWTPMYWMEKMMGTDDCDNNRYGAYYRGMYNNPYAYGANAYDPYRGYGGYRSFNQVNPYATYSGYPGYYRQNPYSAPNGGYYNQDYYGNQLNRNPWANNRSLGVDSFFNGGRSSNPWDSFSNFQGFNSFGNNSSSPFSGFNSFNPVGGSGYGMPLTGMNPLGFGYGSPMMMSGLGNPVGSMNPLGGGFGNPVGLMSPFGGGFGNPMSSMNPMGGGFGNPMSSMNPMGGGFGNPMSSMSPMGGGFGNPMGSMNPLSSGRVSPIGSMNPLGGAFGGNNSGFSPFSATRVRSPFSF